MKKVVIFNCFSSSVYPYIHPCIVPWHLHLVLKFQAPLHEMVNFKVITKQYTIWRPFFRALLVSWGFSTAASEYSSPGLLSSVNVFCASKFTQQHKSQELSGCQPSPSLGISLELNKLTQWCSIFHYADWWISGSRLLISIKAVYFWLSPNFLISTIQLAVLYNFQHSLTLKKVFFSLVLFQRH